ncbi:MAG: YjjG family noncanonical pyrimidine nucleotidase [Flavobacteriales bacterium]|nr:YjjG family noncanonical pyrimidine nucleotidase [Flavobacteriales bacterium]
MKAYRHLFFDLDHTLWDFRTNSRETLTELHTELDLADAGVPDAEGFVDAYEEVNSDLWRSYESGRLDKATMRVLRFRTTLGLFGVRDDKLARSLSAEYLERCPRRTALMPGARELLELVRDRHRLHVITNGFEQTQRTKLESADVAHYFDVVLTSERAGAAKPSAVIFGRALGLAGARVEDALMVGDDPRTDMAGGRACGMDQAHYHPAHDPDPLATYRIAHLSELGGLLLGIR